MKSSKRRIFIAAALLLVAVCGALLGACVRQTSSEWVAQLIEEYYYLPVTVTDADSLTPEELVQKYLDKYSLYYTAEEYIELVYSDAGNSVDYGMTFSYVGGKLVIPTCVGNSPAWNEGLRPGDVITGAVIDGEYVAIDGDDAYEKFYDASQNGGLTSLSTESGVTAQVKVTSAYKQSYVFFATNEAGWSFVFDGITSEKREEDAISLLPGGTAYLRLSEFNGDAALQFRLAVKKINELGCDSVILDLRMNGGGSADITAEIAGCFEKAAGKTLLTAKGKAVDAAYVCESASREETLPSSTSVYVLADCGTASASEALIGALISHEVIDFQDVFISKTDSSLASGSTKNGTTYGKGCMQSIIPNERTGEALRLTTALIYWPNGKCVNDAPLSTSDGCVNIDMPFFTNSSSEGLEQLLRILSERDDLVLAA